MQSKKDRFSIRKLTVGAASVLLGFSFMAMNGQTAKADTISSSDTEVQTSKNDTTTLENKHQSANDKTSAKPNLATYSGLKSFLKSGKSDTEETDKTDTNKEQEKPETPTSSDTNSTAKPAEDTNTTDTTKPADTNQPADTDITKPGDSNSTTPDTDTAVKPNDGKITNQDDPAPTSADVTTWDEMTKALESDTIVTINLKNDIIADPNETKEYTILSDKVVNGNSYTLDIGSNLIQDTHFSYGITFNDLKLMGQKPNNDPESFNFYGYDNDKAITLNNVESDNVSYDNIIKFQNKVEINYNIDGNIFSDYSEPLAMTGSDVTIDFAPTVGTSSSFICDIFILEDSSKVNIHVANTKSALRGTGTTDTARVEVGENATFDMTIDPSVNFLYRVDDGIPPMWLKLKKGSVTHIYNNSSDAGVNPGKDNQIKLKVDTPKIFSITSDTADVNNFNFPITDISGAKMGMITDHYKWIIQDSDNANIMDPTLTDDKMQILANPTLPENILQDGKANKTFQDLSTIDDFQTVINTAGGFNGSAGFELGTDLYDSWKKTDAGRYNISSTSLEVHGGQTSGIGLANDRLNAVDSHDNTPKDIADLLTLVDSINPSNETITGIAWLPNKAMDANGNLIDGGLVKDTTGNLIENIGSQVGPEGDTNLGNAVIQVTYGDGTTDDIPVMLKVILASSSGDTQKVDHGKFPTAEQAKDAVVFNGDASGLNPTYEWYKADGSGPLTQADLQTGNNAVQVLVTYHRADGQPDGTQLVPANVFMGEDQATASGITAGSGPVAVHAVTIPSENDPIVPDFTDSNKWHEFLGGKLDHVTGVTWDDDTNVSDIINDATGEKTAKLRVTFEDGSTAEVDGVQVNVLGGEKADNQSTTTPNGVVPTTDQAKQALKDTTTLTTDLSNAGYDVDYSWAKDDKGTPMDQGYVSYADQVPNKTVPGYVVLTYYKKGLPHTPENVDGKQLVPVDVTINKQQNNLYHDQLAGSGQNSEGVSVAKNTTMDDATAKDAIYKPANFPPDATFKWESPVDTTTTGDKSAWVDVTYVDGTTDRIPVLVNVYDTASKEMPEGKTQTADLNGAVPDAKDSIANNAELPADAQYEWQNEPDLTHEGSAVGTVKVTYADGSIDYVTVPVIVGNANPTQDNDPLGQRTDINYGATATATDDQAKAAISNADSLPEGTTFSWQTAPVVNDLNRLGIQAAVVKVTYPDGTSNNVPVVVDVLSDAHSAARPRAKNVCINVGETIPDAKDAVINSADLTNATKFEYVINPSKDTVGVTQNKIKITYADGSTDEVPTQIIVNEIPSDTATEAEKNNPHVKTVRVNLNSSVNAESVIDNFTELKGNPKAEWVDPNVKTEITDTAGLKQSQIKLTFNDGSVKIVTGYVRVVSDGEKHTDSVTGKTVTKKIGAAITAAEMVNDLPSDAEATFASTVNITDGKVVNPGTYIETIHIKFHDGTEKEVSSVLTVPRQSSQINFVQNHRVVLHVANVGSDVSQAPKEFDDPSSFLGNTEDANIAKIEWATDGFPNVSEANEQAKAKIKITFKDGTSVTESINVKVIGARKADTPTTITAGDNSKLDEGRAKSALNSTDVMAIDYKFPGATYSWAANADGTGDVDISNAGEQHPYVIISYEDGTKEAVQVDLTVNEKPTSGATYKPEATSGSVTTHMTTNGVTMPPEFNDPSKMDDFMQIPGVDDLSSVVAKLTWANDAPTTAGDNQQFQVIAHYKDNSVSDPFTINVNVLSAKKTDTPTTIAAGDKLTGVIAEAALDPAENAKIKAKYPNVKYRWATSADGSGTVDTSKVGSSQPYVVVDYGDGTIQTVQVDLTIKSQADSNTGNIDATQAATITTHLANGLHSEVKVPEFTDPAWIKDNIKLNDGSDDSSAKIDHLSWDGAQPDTIGDGQSLNVVAHYKDGSTSAPFKLPVNVIGAEKKTDKPTTVKVNSEPGEAEAKNALILEQVQKIDGQYPNVKYSFAKNSDGTGKVDTSTPGTSSAYVVVDYGDGTKQTVKIDLTVGSERDADILHPVVAPVNATEPIKAHLIHDYGTGNPITKYPDGFSTDHLDEMKKIISGISDPDWDKVDYLTWAAASPDKPGENQDVQVMVHYKDGSVSAPITVKANIYGVQHLDVAGVTNHAEVTEGEQPTADQAKEVLGQKDLVDQILQQYPNTKFGWANKPDGTGTLDTSKPGQKDAYVIIDYDDGSKQVLKVPLTVNPKTPGDTHTPEKTDGSVTTHLTTTGVATPDEFKDPTKFKDFMQISGSGDPADLVDHVDWADGTGPTAVGDNQQVEVVAHYKDGTKSDTFKINVNVLDARKSDKPTTVCKDSTPDPNVAKNALNEDDVQKIDAHYPNAKYSLAGNSDGTGTVDTSTPGKKNAFVVIDYGDGTTQIVPIELNVADSTMADDNHPVPAPDNATTPILTHLVHDSGTGNPVAKEPASFKDLDKMKQIISIDNWEVVDHLTWSDKVPNKPGDDQDVEVVVHYKDGSVSEPITVKANIVGSEHSDVTGSTPAPAEVAPGKQPTEDQAKNALGHGIADDILQQYPDAKFSWASRSDGTGTLDTSNPGQKEAYVVIKYSDGTKQVVKVPLNVTNNGGSGNDTGSSSSNDSQPIGGSVTIPQGKDLSNDTEYAEQAISNSASLPAGTTYKWQEVPDTSVAGKTLSASVLVTLPGGTKVVVPVSVTIGTKKGETVTLHHNAYLYNEAGQRINELVYKTGSVVPVYGIKTIDGRDFYILDDNHYLATGNVLSTKQKLTHNAYVYNQYGTRVTKKVFKRGKTVKTYGEPINIRGKKYYKLDNGYFLRATNFKKPKRDLTPVQAIAADPTKDRIMHNSYLYDENGKRANGIILNAGTRVKIDQTVHSIAGRNFYKTDKGYYIAVENITGTKVSLKHNAYVYNRYGSRVSKKTLKRGKKITVYGNPVKLHGASYYIVGNKTYVKTANF
ncbi:Rib/alpha-like domain-containing protein [Lactobacillus sp. ESL0731]|uniref:Rib/alpha-like domain-containing protein n=1 Tax=unclassified Lactobacillus TaxID=2620435 RepID=UPI0023FA4839|nr:MULTISPECIES: Rib/alpha-like domain-containing protein [unclassified Lactobacillus]WEV51836.1 Rib/alpha-like domain-containing protein [Lactobacillus sp. ESL0700]WEV62966.1 Rib/alpha-like domain-containing protein [Lactobacillus sp. ESL0731]